MRLWYNNCYTVFIQVYSDELGSVAQNYALMCSTAHSDKDKRNQAAPSFDNVGENIFAAGATNLVINYTRYIVDSWGLEERKFYNYDLNNCQPGRVCGHYTQVRDSGHHLYCYSKLLGSFLFVAKESLHCDACVRYSVSYGYTHRRFGLILLMLAVDLLTVLLKCCPVKLDLKLSCSYATMVQRMSYHS